MSSTNGIASENPKFLDDRKTWISRQGDNSDVKQSFDFDWLVVINGS